MLNAHVTSMGKRDTRRRIVEATAALHEEVGPAATTITAIAERAGVQRLTVYRHFPDEEALIGACSAHWREQHPPPDPASWIGLEDPRRRMAAALAAMYAYFREGAPMLEQVLRDEDEVEALAGVMAPWREYMREVAGGLVVGWGGGEERRRIVRAAVGHALEFFTWRSLAAQGLSDEEAVRLMTRFVAEAAAGSADDTGAGSADETRAGPADDAEAASADRA